jgi:dihydroorotase
MRLLSSSHLKTLCVDVFVTGSSVYRSPCISLTDGSIVGVVDAGRVLDLRGLGSIALPGVVDMHVHLRGLELSYKEDEASGTLAALSGCVTAVVDMPNTKPPLKSVEALRVKLDSLRTRAYVDYGVYAGVPEDELSASRLGEHPIAGFKVYPEDLTLPGRILCRVLKVLEAKGKLLIVHAEHPDMLSMDFGFDRGSYRGCPAETLAVDEVKRLLVECGSRPRVHITHATCPSTIVKAKSYGFTVDVTPHHLLFDESNFRYLTSRWCESKVNPPLRGVIERSSLWKLLLGGYIDAIASDHAPHAGYEKLWLHPSQCSPGFPGLEDWVGVLARIFKSLNLMGMFVELASLNPTRILGIPPRGLGGSRATLTVLGDVEISPGCIHSKARVTPYLGAPRLRCLASVIRGELAYFNGEPLIGGGFGVNLFEAGG